MFKLKGRKGSNNLGMVRKGEIKRKGKKRGKGQEIEFWFVWRKENGKWETVQK